jgi:hypothetical protein
MASAFGIVGCARNARWRCSTASLARPAFKSIVARFTCAAAELGLRAIAVPYAAIASSVRPSSS